MLQSGLLKDRATLDREESRVVNPTDEFRLDGHREAICCTVEYPNTYYLDVAANKEKMFEGWVVLFIDPSYLHQEGTLFAEGNAAAKNGCMIKTGLPGYLSMFPNASRGYPRKATQLLCSPTDLQAEVLIPGPIPVGTIIGMAMKDERQVATELARWETLGIPKPEIPIFVAPVLFKKTEVRDHIWQGRKPIEKLYEF